MRALLEVDEAEVIHFPSDGPSIAPARPRRAERDLTVK
jgi:hypothetical protein